MKTSKAQFKIDDRVQWNWMGRPIKGAVKKIYFKPVSKTLRGTLFKRNGSSEAPAYLIKSEAGSEVLKLQSELTASRKWV